MLCGCKVPEECFRYERGPNMDPHFAESYFWTEHAKKVKQEKLLLKRQQQQRQQQSSDHRLLSESNYFNSDDLVKLTKCRNEAMISEDVDEYSCGAKCGTGNYNGFALYPQRFSINITRYVSSIRTTTFSRQYSIQLFLFVSPSCAVYLIVTLIGICQEVLTLP